MHFDIPDHTLLSIDFSPGSGARPTTGKIVLDLDPIPERIGSLFLPDSARTLNDPMKNISHTAIVVAVGYGSFYGESDSPSKRHNHQHQQYPGLTPDDVQPGDRVVFRLVMSDLAKRRVIADVRRVDAVIEHA
jgi:hypothetical protein